MYAFTFDVSGDPMQYPLDLRTNLMAEVSSPKTLSIIVEYQSSLIGMPDRAPRHFRSRKHFDMISICRKVHQN
jgi:hypothetical protein